MMLLFIDQPDHVVLLARFTMRQDGGIDAIYTDDELAAEVDSWGIPASDGVRFLAEVKRVFGRSSRYLLQ